MPLSARLLKSICCPSRLQEAHNLFIAPPGRVTASHPLRMQLNTTPCMKVIQLATAIITGDTLS